jgi:hypothetical protein
MNALSATEATESVPVDDLAALARQINAEHDQVISCVRRGAEHAVRAGKLLWSARNAVPRGEWCDWVATNTRLSERTAQVYMQLSRDLPQNSAAGLSMAGALKLLEQLKSPPELQEKITVGRPRVSKRDPVSEAIKRDPTAVLDKAWAAAGDVERIAFANRIQKDLARQ